MGDKHEKYFAKRASLTEVAAQVGDGARKWLQARHSLKTVVTPLSGGKTPNLVRREIDNMQV